MQRDDFLNKINKKENFNIPENYFNEFPDQLLSKIGAQSVVSPKVKVNKSRLSLKHFTTKFIIPIASVAATVAIIFTLVNSPKDQTPPTNNIISSTISNDSLNHTPSDVKYQYSSSGEKVEQNNSLNQKKFPSHTTNNITSKQIIEKTEKQSKESNSVQYVENDQDKYSNKNNSSFIHPVTNNQSIGNQIVNPQYSSSNQIAKQNTNPNSVFTFNLGNDTVSEKSVKINANIEANKKAIYSYEWTNGESTPYLLVEKSGTYGLHLINTLSGETAYDEIEVKIIPKPFLNPIQEYSYCESESIELFPLSEEEQPELYSYKWSNGKTSSFIYLQNLPIGVYSYSVEIIGAKTYKKTFVVKINDCELIIPNVITPNGDGFNDLFIIEGLNKYPKSKILIYDKNGKKVYENNNYQNNWTACDLKDGTYFFILELNNSQKTVRQGIISVIR